MAFILLPFVLLCCFWTSPSLYAQGLQMGQALRNIVLEPGNQQSYKNLDDASRAFDETLQTQNGSPTATRPFRS